jgi:AbrB family looped-hinge helix DNA binding protein
METTRLSTKGQVILPKGIRDAHQWSPGTEFLLQEVAGGILLRPARPFPSSRLEAVYGCLRYSGRPKTAPEMAEAIRKEVRERRGRGRY